MMKVEFIVDDVSLSEWEVVRKIIQELHENGDSALYAVQYEREEGKVTIKLNDMWGKEGLELAFIVLHRMERFREEMPPKLNG